MICRKWNLFFHSAQNRRRIYLFLFCLLFSSALLASLLLSVNSVSMTVLRNGKPATDITMDVQFHGFGEKFIRTIPVKDGSAEFSFPLSFFRIGFLLPGNPDDRFQIDRIHWNLAGVPADLSVHLEQKNAAVNGTLPAQVFLRTTYPWTHWFVPVLALLLLAASLSAAVFAPSILLTPRRWRTGKRCKYTFRLLWLTAGLLLLSAVLILFLDNDPLTLKTQHAFRQSQTLISSMFMTEPGHLLNYETPVLGAPWSIPMEFPLYQTLVAGVSYLGVPLVCAGKLVSSFFFLLTLVPLFFVCRFFTKDLRLFLMNACLFLAFPFTLYWGMCATMMESCALFFGVLFTAGMLCYLKKPSAVSLSAGIAGAVCCGLVKITTLPAFVLFTGLIWIYFLIRKRITFRSFLIPSIAGCVSLVPILLWVGHADRVKALNEWGQTLISSNLTTWNFGPLSMRFDPNFYSRLIRFLLSEVFFSSFTAFSVASVILLGLFFCRKRRLMLIFLLIGWSSAFLIFSNLYFVHTYYQMGNILFLLCACGMVFFLFVRRSAYAVFPYLLLILSFQFSFYATVLPRIHDAAASDKENLPIWNAVKNNTPANSAILVLGDEWSSLVPFKCERKGLCMTLSTKDELFRRVIADPESFLGGLKLSALIIVRWKPLSPLELELADKLVSGKKLRKISSSQLTLYLL